VLRELGCAPPASIRMSAHDLGAGLIAAAAWRAEPLPPDPLTTFLLAAAFGDDDDVTGGPLDVVVLASSDMVRVGLRELAIAAGGTVRFDTTRSDVLVNVLSEKATSTLVADSTMLHPAEQLSRRFRIPLLVAALTRSAGYRALGLAHGIVIEPVDPGTLAAALRSIALGESYCDDRLEEPLRHMPLTRTEQAVCRAILQRQAPAAIARRLSIKPATLRWHLSNIYGKLGVESTEEIRSWVDQPESDRLPSRQSSPGRHS
jgi:DNA-binding NarL/FixJ family response regulator